MIWNEAANGALYADCREGRGRIVGFVSRGRTKKICAVILIRRRFYDVSLADLRAVRASRRKKS